jgi:hypothetical protein
MFTYLFKLIGQNPVQCATVAEWHQHFILKDNILAFTELLLPTGQYLLIETFFTGTDKLFQTTIKDGANPDINLYAATWKEAIRVHNHTVNDIFKNGYE